VTFVTLYIPQNDSVPQQESAAQDTAGQAEREARRKKRREERKKKKQEEEEARKKKKEQQKLVQAKRDSIKKADSLATAAKLYPQAKQDSIQGTSLSLFTGHELTPKNQTPIVNEREHAFWMFALLFTAFTIFVSMRVIYSKRFRQELGAFFTSRAVGQMMREEYALSNRVSIGLSLLFVLLFSLFLYQAFVYYGYFDAHKRPGPEFYFIICGLVVISIALKLLAVRILGSVFKVESAVNEYIFNIFLHNKALGLFLLPVTIAIAFVRLIPVQYLIIGGWTIIGLVVAYRTLRTTLGSVQTAGISKYYLFLYLCTLELLPLIVIIKVFRSQT
jgi:hypothetical protein